MMRLALSPQTPKFLDWVRLFFENEGYLSIILVQ